MRICTGQSLDQMSGLYSLRARYYLPSSGRFLVRDPLLDSTIGAFIQLLLSLNTHSYTYANNNPSNEYDPQGRFGIALDYGQPIKLVSIGNIAATAALAAAVYCALALTTTGLLGFVGVDLSLIKEIPPECIANQIRVQLQNNLSGSRDTLSVIAVNIPQVGVTVAQARQALKILFLRWEAGDPLGAFVPRTYRSNLISAIIRMSAELDRFPPGGISGDNLTFLREDIPQKRPRFRLDMENMRGRNLWH